MCLRSELYSSAIWNLGPNLSPGLQTLLLLYKIIWKTLQYLLFKELRQTDHACLVNKTCYPLLEKSNLGFCWLVAEKRCKKLYLKKCRKSHLPKHAKNGIGYISLPTSFRHNSAQMVLFLDCSSELHSFFSSLPLLYLWVVLSCGFCCSCKHVY